MSHHDNNPMPTRQAPPRAAELAGRRPVARGMRCGRHPAPTCRDIRRDHTRCDDRRVIPAGRLRGGPRGPRGGGGGGPEPPAAGPGDRLPATLEGWRARFPDLGAWAFDQVNDILPGRAPTDTLTPRERSEVGLGLVRCFIRGYEPAPEDPDGEVLAILAAAGPYIAAFAAEAGP